MLSTPGPVPHGNVLVCEDEFLSITCPCNEAVTQEEA